MKAWILPLLIVLSSGCMSHVVVKMPPPGTEEGTGKPLLAEVKVNDLRKPGVAASTREAAFGVPMGNIAFDPPESQVLKQFLEVELTKRLRKKGVVEKWSCTCDLVEFGVNTVTTPIYWDVVGQVRLVLKRDGQEFPLSGTYTQRTFVWPGENIIRSVVEESLKQVAAGLTTAISELATPQPGSAGATNSSSSSSRR